MTIAACPQCHDEVTIPPGAPRTAQVRCPWCREQFELSAVLDRLPPALEIVAAPQPSAAEGEEFRGFALAADEDLRIAESDKPQTSGGSFRFSGPVSGSSPAVVAPRAQPVKSGPAVRPRRKEKNPLVEIMKVVVGGLVGLMLAQLILWWLPGGLQRDPAELAPVVGEYLPFVVPKNLRLQRDSAGGDTTGDDSSPSSSQFAANDSQRNAASSTQRSQRDTAGGESSVAYKDQDALPPARDSATDFPPAAISRDAQGEDGDLLALSEGADNSPLLQQPFEIPEPDLNFDPGASLESVAPIAPSQAETPTAIDAEAQGFVGVSDAPLYVRDEVSESLAQAQAAQQAWESAGQDSTEADARYYSALTALAEKLTYADPNDARIAAIAQRAGELLTGERDKIVERARLVMSHAPARLSASKENRPDNGIVLFGRVKSTDPKGSLYETELEMPAGAGPSVMSIFSKDDPKHPPGTPVMVLGTLVDEPSRRLSGYEGGAPTVVWMGHSVALPK